MAGRDGEIDVEVSSDEDDAQLVTLGDYDIGEDDLVELDSESEASESDREESEGEEEEEGVGEGDSKKRKKPPAAIWGTAAKKVDGRALCLVCNTTVGLPMSSTTGIRSHVKIKHPTSEEYKRFLELEAKQKAELEKNKQKPPTQPNLLTFFHSKKPLSAFEKERITEALADFIVQTNTSLKMVENPAFRKLVFKLNSGYIVPSRATITRKIDDRVEEKKKALKVEVVEDVKEYKTVAVTTDGGPSHDQNKTKKNAVTVSRISSGWKMKTDTLALEVAEGSQTGEVIRTVVKDNLRKFGLEECKVNMTTDDAAAPRSARTPGRHPAVGLQVRRGGALLISEMQAYRISSHHLCN